MKVNKKLTALILSIFLCAPLLAGDIFVTGLKSADNRASYEITINNAITIKEVELIDAGGRRLLKFPEYVSKKKRVYPQVIVTTRKANEALRNAVINNAAETGRQCVIEFKISKFTPFKMRSNMKALATVSFNEALDIECKIIGGKNGPWVAWPSRRSGKSGQWFKQVIFTDKLLRESVEESLLSRYQAMSEEEER